MQVEVPFTGRLASATLFTLVDKIGVSSVRLNLRDAEKPFDLLNHDSGASSASVTSASNGVEDPGVHRFLLHGISPVFNATQKVALCIGVDEIDRLPADDPTMTPFLHLPLSEVGSKQAPATRTFLIASKDHDEQTAAEARIEDPWHGLSITLRAEFVAVPLESGGEPPKQQAEEESVETSYLTTSLSPSGKGFLAQP